MKAKSKELSKKQLQRVNGGADLLYDSGYALGRYIAKRPMPKPSPYGCVGGAR